MLHAETAELRVALHDEMGELRTGMDAEMAQLRAEMSRGHEVVKDQLHTDIQRVVVWVVGSMLTSPP